MADVVVTVRFASVKKRFVFELRELRGREQTQLTAQCIISLLMGMRFFRVKVCSKSHGGVALRHYGVGRNLY